MLKVIEAKKEDRDTVMNLLEKYLYEFSQWEKTDVNDKGLYGYEYLDCYFEEKTDFCLSEFFIMNKYRRKGYGKEAVFQVLNMHHGKWQLKRHPHNIGSVHFWNNVIAEYTKGNFRLEEKYPNKEVVYDDGTLADVFFFEN
ncbi:MAG: GNAT family N-acetyltransferase [Treponema sp.]|nr:GNAT family N-acetyltransferase [Treponema sp.]